MTNRSKTRMATAAFGAALLAATAAAGFGAAQAVQAPDAARVAPDPQALQKGTAIAHRLLAPAQAQIDKLGDKISPLQRAKIEAVTGPRGPEYIDDAITALQETWPETSADTEAILAHALAERLTPEELRAGAAFMQGPDGDAFFEIWRAEMGKKGAPVALSPKAQAALARLQATPAGRSFLAKVTDYKGFLQPYTADLIATLVPPALGRFCHKVVVANETRLAADTSDTDPAFAKAHAAGAAQVNAWYAKMTPADWAKARRQIDDPLVKAQIARLNRPEIPQGWLQAAANASADWMQQEQAKIADEYGRFMARLFTTEEIEAFGRFVDGPYADAVNKMKARIAAGQTVPAAAGAAKDPFAQAPELKAAILAFVKTDEGKSMLAKVMNFRRTVPAAVDELTPLWAGLMERFADRAERLQADKRLVRGW